MKTIVSVQEISEFDIKPVEMVRQWQNLVKKEIKDRWPSRNNWIHVNCHACKQDESLPAFERFGIQYFECRGCGSLYAPWRPNEEELWAWYRESVPAVFWREHLLSASADSRREKITQPRADWVLDGIAEYLPDASRLVDVSTYGRTLVELVCSGSQGLSQVLIAGMTADLEGEPTSRFAIQPTLIADLPKHGQVDVVIAIDVLDRASDLVALIHSFERLLAPGGVLFVTTPVASGFEIQTLWERSITIIPPDKLNLPTVKWLSSIFSAPTWEILELSTPGMFDVETVFRAIEAEPEAPWPRAVRTLVQHSDSAMRTSLVELLQSMRLTSFARLVVRKTPDAC